jgi:hypothetical protein
MAELRYRCTNKARCCRSLPRIGLTMDPMRTAAPTHGGGGLTPGPSSPRRSRAPQRTTNEPSNQR